MEFIAFIIYFSTLWTVLAWRKSKEGMHVYVSVCVCEIDQPIGFETWLSDLSLEDPQLLGYVVYFYLWLATIILFTGHSSLKPVKLKFISSLL